MIPYAKPFFGEKEKQYLNKAFDSGWVSGGEFIEKLESKLSETFGTKYCFLTSNGTTALHNLYLSLGLTRDDEIIVPGFCFLAAANIAVHMGIKPVFVEVNKDTWCINPGYIEKSITDKTKAIVVIHTYGNVCDMDSIMIIAKKYNLNIIEDCAESIFSKYNGRYCGTFGVGSIFSMQATKAISTGEGGFVLTSSGWLSATLPLYRSHGLLVRGTYNHEVAGHNFRLTNLQAAIGLAQIENKDIIIKERNRVYEEYKSFLSNQEGVKLQEVNSKVEPVMWALGIKLDSKYYQDRDNVIKQLLDLGIEIRPGFVASSLLKIYDSHKLEVCEELSNNVISLPIYPDLNEVEYICKSLLSLRK